MKVKELIKKLKKLDPEAEVYSYAEHAYWPEPIFSVKGEFINDENEICDEEDEDTEPAVVLS